MLTMEYNFRSENLSHRVLNRRSCQQKAISALHCKQCFPSWTAKEHFFSLWLYMHKTVGRNGLFHVNSEVFFTIMKHPFQIYHSTHCWDYEKAWQKLIFNQQCDITLQHFWWLEPHLKPYIASLPFESTYRLAQPAHRYSWWCEKKKACAMSTMC